METLNARLNQQGYKCWLESGLVLKALKNGLAGFLNDEVRDLQKTILTGIQTGLPPGMAVHCTSCSTASALGKKWTCRSSNICTDIKRELESQHEKGRLLLANTDVSLWTDVSHYWEMGKCFISAGYKDKQTAQETDCSGLLGLVINCKKIKQKFSLTLTQPDDTFDQIRNLRNEKIMHSADLLLVQANLDDLVKKSLAILQDPMTMLTKKESIDAAQQIRTIHKADFTITLEDELQVLGDTVKAVKVKQSEHEEHVKQMIQDHKREISAVKSDLEEKNTHMKTMEIQLEAQLKQIVEVDVTLRNVNTILDTTRESTQLIKTDMEHIRQKNESIHKLISEEQNKLKAALADISDRLSALTSDHEKTQIRVATIESENTETKQRVDALESKQPLADSKHISEEDTASLRQCLVDMYADYVDLVPLSPLCRDEGLPIHQIYTPVIVEEDMSKGRHEAGSSECKLITSYRELLYQDGVLAKNTFMVGSAGRGKSTYCLRMLDDWRNGKEKQSSQNDSLSNGEKDMLDFEYVFFISLRSVDNSDKAIIDMIFNQLLFEHPKYKDTVRHVLETTPDKCLVILDGIDEWSPSQEACHKLKEQGLPNRDDLYGCPTFMTSRPWKLEDLRTKLSHSIKIVIIKGLGKTEVESLVRTVLINYCHVPKESTTFPQKIKDFLEKFGKGRFKHLLEIPLITTWLVTLWYESSTLDESLTGLYVRLTECLIRKAEGEGRLSPFEMSMIENVNQLSRIDTFLFWVKRSLMKSNSRLDMLKNNLTLSKYSALLLSLGELAFASLTSTNTNLVFPKDELEKKIGKEKMDVSLKIGLICQSKVPGKTNTKYVSVSFFHKTMQEFLAALWLVFAADKPFDILSTLCKDMLTLSKMSNIIVFVSGLDSKLGCRLSQHIVHVINGDTKILNYRLYPKTETVFFKYMVKPVYDIQCDCFQECLLSTKANRDGFQVSDVVFSSSNMKVSTDIMSLNFSNIKSIDIDLSFDEDINADTHRTFYSLLSRMEKIQRITITNKWLTNDSLVHLTNLSKTLRCLSLYRVCIEECGVLPTMLHTLHKVTRLGLYDVSMPYKSFDDLMSYLQVSNITVLELGKIRYSDQTMKDNGIDLNLSQYHNLQDISLRDLTITDMDLSNNHNMHTLELFDMTISVVRIPVDSIQRIKLDRISGSVLELYQKLPQCSKLNHITVKGIDNDEAHAFASSVPTLTQINYIYLRRVNMTAADWTQVVDSLVSKQHICRVNLVNTNIGEEYVSRLSSARNIILNEQLNYYSELRCVARHMPVHPGVQFARNK